SSYPAPPSLRPHRGQATATHREPRAPTNLILPTFLKSPAVHHAVRDAGGPSVEALSFVIFHRLGRWERGSIMGSRWDPGPTPAASSVSGGCRNDGEPDRLKSGHEG